MDKIEAFNKRQVEDNAKRVHAAMCVTQGTAGTPTLEKVEQDLAWAIELMQRDDFESDYAHWGGFLIYRNKTASPWPTYTVYVPSTQNFYVRED